MSFVLQVNFDMIVLLDYGITKVILTNLLGTLSVPPLVAIHPTLHFLRTVGKKTGKGFLSAQKHFRTI